MKAEETQRLLDRRNEVDPRFAEQIAKDKARQEASAVFRLMKVFDAIDTDHSGVISRTELKDKLIKDDVLEKILRMKMDLTPRTMESESGNRELDVLLDTMDQRGDGNISWQDFVEGVAQVRPRPAACSAQLEVNRAAVFNPRASTECCMRALPSHPLHRSSHRFCSTFGIRCRLPTTWCAGGGAARLPHHRPQPHGLREPRRVPHQVAKG